LIIPEIGGGGRKKKEKKKRDLYLTPLHDIKGKEKKKCKNLLPSRSNAKRRNRRKKGNRTRCLTTTISCYTNHRPAEGEKKKRRGYIIH